MVISDEVYANLTFGCNPFVPMGAFSSIAPVVTLGSISKKWVVPGWRFGWIVLNDPHGILHQSRVWSLSLSYFFMRKNHNLVACCCLFSSVFFGLILCLDCWAHQELYHFHNGSCNIHSGLLQAIETSTKTPLVCNLLCTFIRQPFLKF